MRYSELIQLIKKNGCTEYRQGKNHTIYINTKTGKKFPVSHHKTQDVPTGTLKSIMKDAGLE